MSLKPMKYNRALDHVLLAMALLQKGNTRGAMKQLSAAVRQPDARAAMQTLELNARYATNTLRANEDIELEVEDLGDVDLEADELSELVIESEDHELEEDIELDLDAMDEEELEEVIEAARRMRARKAGRRVRARRSRR